MMQQAAARALEQLLVPLASLLSEVVLVGGAAIPLWLNVPGVPPARATNDTDVIVAARSRVHYYRIGERLRQLEFIEVSESKVLCRWMHRPTGALYDVMPLDPDILGFSNEWYDETFISASSISLPDGMTVSVATPPYLVATKFVAFRDRGGGDYLASHDMYDIMALIDGCSTIVSDVQNAGNVGAWIAREFNDMLASDSARDAILNYLPYNSPPDAERVLMDRLELVKSR